MSFGAALTSPAACTLLMLSVWAKGWKKGGGMREERNSVYVGVCKRDRESNEF